MHFFQFNLGVSDVNRAPFFVSILDKSWKANVLCLGVDLGKRY